MTDEKIRALIAEAEARFTDSRIGKSWARETDKDLVVMRKLIAAFEAFTVPDGDARERIARILHPGYGVGDGYYSANCKLCADAERQADEILAAVPVPSRDTAGEIEGAVAAVLNRLDEMNGGEISYEVYRELHDLVSTIPDGAAPEPEWEPVGGETE